MTSGAQFAALPLNCDQAIFFSKKKNRLIAGYSAIGQDSCLICARRRQLIDHLPVLLLNQPNDVRGCET